MPYRHLIVFGLLGLLTSSCRTERTKLHAPERHKVMPMARRVRAQSLGAMAECALYTAEMLSRSGVAYHPTAQRDVARRSRGAAVVPEALSPTEFVWMIYRRCGLPIGERPMTTREWVSEAGAYPDALIRLPVDTQQSALRPGDILVYEPDDPGDAPKSESADLRPGHIVVLVSPKEKLIVGAHEHISTRAGVEFGVSYRTVRGSLRAWTDGQPLRAIYRVRSDRPLPASQARDVHIVFGAGSPISVDEESTIRLPIRLTGSASSVVALYAVELPTGAVFDAERREIRWTPDFTKGPARYAVEVAAKLDTGRLVHGHAFINVRDSVQPPDPVVVSSVDLGRVTRHEVRQTSDGFLDGPSRIGQVYQATVITPNRASDGSMRVKVGLHGLSGKPCRKGQRDRISVCPHDPLNSYWYGYRAAGDSVATNFTERRVIHLLDWVLRTFDQADPERVTIIGGSMGGAGAATIGLHYWDHFAAIETDWGESIPRLHRRVRIRTLSKLWGPPPPVTSTSTRSPWTSLDVTAQLARRPEKRSVYVSAHFGTHDPIIHFSTLVEPSPVSHRSLVQTLQQLRIPHFITWDAGGHGTNDPKRPRGWWRRLNPLRTSSLFARNQPVVAFSASSLDDPPSRPDGQPGAPYGVINRCLRWEPQRVVDAELRFAIEVRLSESCPSPAVTADVTPRRFMRFRPIPGERVHVRLSDTERVVEASRDGTITIPAVKISKMPVRLVGTRHSWRSSTLD